MSDQYQFGRALKLILSNADEFLIVENLSMSFSIQKTLLGYPARGRINIRNLGEANIQKITKRYTSVDLIGGYVGAEALLFRGNIMNYSKTRLTPTSEFSLIVKSSTAAWEDSTFSKAYTAGTPAATMINDVANSFEGVIPGSLVTDQNWPTNLADVTLSGSSRRVMDQLARDYNFDWNIVEGEVITLPRGQTLQDKPTYVITPATGLIGSPVITELGVDFRVLLNPAIMLGRQVEMRSKYGQLGQAGIEFRKVRNTADGFYKVMDIRMTGDTNAIDWYYDLITWGTTNEFRN
jgi:hypothetical protein